MALQETFNSLEEIKKHDRMEGDFLILKDFSFLKPVKEGKVIMAFKWGNEKKTRAVKVSVKDFKRIREKVREFYDFYESDLLKEF